MDHEVSVTRVPDRKEWFASICRDQAILHVGCCDVPVFAPDTNLHIFLARLTSRLDGLDVSEEGIRVLERHVHGNYFTSPRDVREDYDLVIVPEVLEHTRDPESFLRELFRVSARRFLFTAPSFEWFRQTREENGVFFESVHGDHKAWYSPYTLLNTLRPFINEERDEVEVFLLSGIGSVAVLIDTHADVRPRAAKTAVALTVDAAREEASGLTQQGRTSEAIALFEAGFESSGDVRFAHEELHLRLSIGQNLEALRRGVQVMSEFPSDVELLMACAEATERLGDPAQAAELRELARQHSSAPPAR